MSKPSSNGDLSSSLYSLSVDSIGFCPVIIWYSIAPIEYMSVKYPCPALSLYCSGAEYPTFMTFSPSFAPLSSFNIAAPKSNTFTESSPAINILSGLISLCIIPLACIFFKASTTGSMIVIAISGDSAPCFSR